jgi:hypothetical protein
MPSEPAMRVLFAVLTVATALAALTPAQAEKRIFIIANNPDGYGVDRCLANGSSCGNGPATTYCRSHEFNKALSFHKIDRDDITGAIPTAGGTGCRGSTCDEFVAIECMR